MNFADTGKSIMSMFQAAPAAGAGGSAMALPGANKPGASSDANPAQFQGDGNGQLAIDPNAAAGGGEAQSPLEPFSKLWENVEGAKSTAVDYDAPYFTTDMNSLAKQADGIDFVKNIPGFKELGTKVLAGDVDAFAQVLNAVARGALTQSVSVGTRLSESAVKNYNKRLQQDLPEKFRGFGARSQALDNPAFSHPAVKPIVENVRNQVMAKNPNLSAEQVNEQVVAYMEAMQSAFQPTAGKEDQSRGTTDWSMFETA
jgi:hypothetical protein